MHWKIKAAIQNAVSLLPASASYAAYYWIQRQFGGLRRTSPIGRLTAGVETWRRIKDQGGEPVGKVFFEVGTGIAPMYPLAYWLMGAERTITVDLNPYLKSEIVLECLDYIEAHQEEVARLFGAWLQPARMEALVRFPKASPFALRRFLDLCAIEYVAPGDAARTSLPARSVDFHTSFTVLEHIPPDVLAKVLEEGNRIVREDGLFVHMVDYSDHFSHSDRSISAINCLQYSEAEWAGYAGNRYMYMNRLRHDDMLALFHAAGHRMLAVTPHVDERVLAVLESGQLPLSEPFRSKSRADLSIRDAWIVSQRRPGKVPA